MLQSKHIINFEEIYFYKSFEPHTLSFLLCHTGITKFVLVSTSRVEHENSSICEIPACAID